MLSNNERNHLVKHNLYAAKVIKEYRQKNDAERDVRIFILKESERNTYRNLENGDTRRPTLAFDDDSWWALTTSLIAMVSRNKTSLRQSVIEIATLRI